MPDPTLRVQLCAAFSLRSNLRALLTPEREHFRPVDGLRALSIVWVIAFHSAVFLGGHLPREAGLVMRLMRRGFLGVDVFFVISGFLVGHLVMRERRDRGTFSLGRFYQRRALRILPAYYVSLALYCAVIATRCESVWANLLFVNNFLPERRQCMNWAWSLAIEEQFYLCFPWFVMLLYRLARGRLALLVGALVLAFVIRGSVLYVHGLYQPGANRAQLWNDLFIIRPYTRFGELLCGVIAAYLLLHTDVLARLPRWPWRLPLAGLAAWVMIDMAVRRQPIFVYGWPPAGNFLYYTVSTYLFTLAVAYLILTSLTQAPEGRWIARALSARWLYPIGQLSYSGYLLHIIVIHLFTRWGLLDDASSVPELLSEFSLVLLVTLLVASVMYLLVERPLMNLRALRL